MDIDRLKAAIEAQFLMGHAVPSPHTNQDRTAIVDFSWEEDQVRQALHVPLTDLWGQRVLELEMQGLATFCCHTQPVRYDDNWNEIGEIPGWRDMPRSEWGTVSIHPPGVLKLATLYSRPYVTFDQASTVLLAHWTLVEAEAEARLHAPHDEARWAREWPERALLWKARQAQWEADADGD